MAIKSALYGLLGAGALSLASAPAALAGCGGIGNCDAGVAHSTSSFAPDYGPTTVRTGVPYDFMTSVRYQRAPHVSLTRIHGLGPVADLGDAPHGNSGGCNAHATGYCHGGHAKPVSVEMFGAAPQVPMMRAPVMPRPHFGLPQAPVMAAPVQSERVVAIGGGFDASKFAPRTYGSLDITPGIVHAPTSIVDRDPQRAQAVLDRVAPGSVTPALSGVPIRFGTPYAQPYRLDPVPFAIPSGQPGLSLPPTGIPAMPPGPRSIPIMPAPGVVSQAPGLNAFSVPTGMPGAAGAPMPQADGTFASRVGADGTYWEKVSGVTMFGDTVATSVICKRKLPTQTVNPTVGVPYPVPVPVAQDCERVPGHLHAYEGRGRY